MIKYAIWCEDKDAFLEMVDYVDENNDLITTQNVEEAEMYENEEAIEVAVNFLKREGYDAKKKTVEISYNVVD